MKNTQKGSTTVVLIVIIVLLVVGFGAYIYLQNNQSSQQQETVSQASSIQNIPVTQTTIATSTAASSPADGITFTASPSSGASPLQVTFTATIDSSVYGEGPFVINFGAGPVNHVAVGLTGKVGSTLYTTEPEAYTYTSPGTYTATISKGGCAAGNPNPSPCNLGETIDTATVTVLAAQNTSMGSKIYTNSTFGFSLTYPQSLVASTDSTGKVSLTVQGSTNNPTTIVNTTNAADDSNGKWGTFVISYSNNGWVVQEQSERDGSLYSQPITPSFYTSSGLPVFNGGIEGHGWGRYDYIVALSHTKFLIISGPDNSTDATYNAATDPTVSIVKSITVVE